MNCNYSSSFLLVLLSIALFALAVTHAATVQDGIDLNGNPIPPFFGGTQPPPPSTPSGGNGGSGDDECDDDYYGGGWGFPRGGGMANYEWCDDDDEGPAGGGGGAGGPPGGAGECCDENGNPQGPPGGPGWWGWPWGPWWPPHYPGGHGGGGGGNGGNNGGGATTPSGGGGGASTPPGGNNGGGNGATTPPGGNSGGGNGATTPSGNNSGGANGGATTPNGNNGGGNGDGGATTPSGNNGGGNGDGGATTPNSNNGGGANGGATTPNGNGGGNNGGGNGDGGATTPSGNNGGGNGDGGATTPNSNNDGGANGGATTPNGNNGGGNGGATTPNGNNGGANGGSTAAESTPKAPPSSTPPCMTTCATGWNMYEGSCFLVKQGNIDYPTATDSCAQQGGALASIPDEATNDFLSGILKKEVPNPTAYPAFQRFFVGFLFIRATNGTIINMSWLNGANATFGNPTARGFAQGSDPWASGSDWLGQIEPKVNITANCGQLIMNTKSVGKWAAVQSCSNSTTILGGYICERNPCAPPTPSCPKGWSPYQGECFKVFNLKVDYPTAKSACVSQGSLLASVPDIGTNAFINSLLLAAVPNPTAYPFFQRFFNGIQFTRDSAGKVTQMSWPNGANATYGSPTNPGFEQGSDPWASGQDWNGQIEPKVNATANCGQFIMNTRSVGKWAMVQHCDASTAITGGYVCQQKAKVAMLNSS